MEDHPVKIPQHRHCRKCGRAFVGEGDYCCEECKQQDGAAAKKKIRRYMLFIAVVWIVTIAAVIIIGV
ncbi:MAG: DUF2116 family Zn-ribbon domain-containing protein [Candidatus Methanomethylophilus sp.]|mgnify:CR=1 FL=1|nr:DUF2116 family Zn-ribbon domain-containing protein [Methanomethylophilus sp.]MDD3233327.1 DUF2116 family Zn-ribbon domain-containing protein [Methanomethylophilus sp.]MDD4222167.1 DUF2116 family Zn-ribbon domain-containing protein [Methanomethylophilus sp.]MDD4668326.1 DUF2116 family Zn-ribbon domain-containing protein [Methanomethylophilus sp.]